jgi:V8-like Glu-specific endopeptidase
MFIKKNKSIKAISLIFFGLLFISFFSSALTFNPIDEQNDDIIELDDNYDSDQSSIDEEFADNEQLNNLNFYGEEKTESNYDRNAFEWRPISETLKDVQFNSESSVGGIETASYNALTGIETITAPQFTPTPESSPEVLKVEPYAGLLGGIGTIESVIGGDGRTVYDNLAFPGRTIVKLYIADPWGGNWVGSGAVIDNFHILTAGHCAYIRDGGNNGWATDIEVVAAMDTSDTPSDPYGSAWVTNMRSYTGWTVSGSSQHDWAVLTLDRNIGIYTGWMGRTTAGSSSSIYTGTMNVAGYPTDLSSGNRMYWDADAGDGATTNNHFYWADTAGGMSGGPVWRFDGSNRYIMTVHAYGRDGLDSNYGTRLNTDKYDRIFTWLGEDSAPTDKADLIDRGASYSSASPGSVTAGITAFSVSNDIRNVGTAASGNYVVHYYASTNTYISTSDYYIGSSGTVSTPAFGTTTTPNWAGTFPNIPGGSYYIGWIIDGNGNVNEFDEGNNKAYISSPVSVTGLNPDISYIEVRVRDSITYAYLSSALVKCYTAATTTLIDSGYTDINGFYNITNLAVGDYDVKVTKEGYVPQTKFNTIHNLVKGYDDDYLTFYLVPRPPDSSWIEVNVKDSSTSNPLTSAYVQVVNMSSGLVIQTGYTNGAGFYNATGLWIGWYEVTISKSGYATQTKQNYINWNYDDDYLTFFLVQKAIDSGYIEVRVYNETGGPKLSVYVECYYDNGTFHDNGFTDSSGFYNITGLVVGWYVVNVSYTGYYEQSRSNYINWRGDDDYLSFYLDNLPPNSGYIDVTVYDSVSYFSIANAFVEVTNVSSGLVINSGYTDGSGFYKIVNLTIGMYSVEVIKDGYHGQTQQDFINWVGDDDYLSFYLDELPPDSGYIEVTVLDDDTLLPIENVLVTCNYLNGTYFTDGYTDSSGVFNVTGLYVGWYTIEVSHADYGGDTMNNYINWNGDDDYLTFYLVITPPGWIEVRVYDAYNYNPIPNAYVRCFNTTSGDLFDEGFTDSTGFYNITGLLIGFWTVNVSHATFIMDSQDDYINWRGDDDYLYFYLYITFEPITGPIAIFQDRAPWNLNVTEPILVDNSLSYTMYNSSDMGIVDLSSFQKVIISSDQTQQFYDRLAANTTWFESYVANGGILLISTADNGPGGGIWDDSFIMPGGLNKTFSLVQNVTINIPQHPVLLTPSLIEDDELDNWLYSSHGYYNTYPIGTKEILLDGNTLNPVLVELEFGNGFIISTNQPLEWNHNLNYTRLLENLILYDPTFYIKEIIVTTPDNSSLWLAGLAQDIYWNSVGNIASVRIDLYKNGTFLAIITPSTPNDGAFNWAVSFILESSDLYQIRISDAEYPGTFDDSEYFEIYSLTSATPGIPGYSLILLLLSSAGISIILLRKKPILKINN